jgi:hypothetical protein
MHFERFIEINFHSEMEAAVIGHAFSKRISAHSIHAATSLDGARNQIYGPH